MATLTFPTIAEQVIKEFEDSQKTTSLAVLAARRGCHTERTFEGVTTYFFDDDTSIEVKGRGAAHAYEARLP